MAKEEPNWDQLRGADNIKLQEISPDITKETSWGSPCLTLASPRPTTNSGSSDTVDINKLAVLLGSSDAVEHFVNRHLRPILLSSFKGLSCSGNYFESVVSVFCHYFQWVRLLIVVVT